MTVRERLEAIERQTLSKQATLAAESRGREREEEPDAMRTCFMRDRDRIIHSKSFRRLKHKTQVFLSPEGDHYRTRLTHTLEVSQISRTVARGLGLNEDLTEAIALGHDLGHTPFGHAGERALSEARGYPFHHNEQSLRVVRLLEREGKGLNLTREVMDGIVCHTGPKQADTPEGRVVHFADRIAYVNHDIDDAVRAGVLSEDDIPFDIKLGLGASHSRRIGRLVEALIEYGQKTGEIGMDAETAALAGELRDFMYEAVYKNPVAKGEEGKCEAIVRYLYRHFSREPGLLPGEYWTIADRDGMDVAVCDYIAGMTDRYAVNLFESLTVPKSWNKY
ncbi:MAG: deoxyguanosinetriphosphate triphosphohydrolase [Clostridia bacterium]|nr:deoxyguanosinetriphosphate triphosphohydrolase [Clostridia bacterium]